MSFVSLVRRGGGGIIFVLGQSDLSDIFDISYRRDIFFNSAVEIRYMMSIYGVKTLLHLYNGVQYHGQVTRKICLSFLYAYRQHEAKTARRSIIKIINL